jgi:hypothetical protein
MFRSAIRSFCAYMIMLILIDYFNHLKVVEV